MNARLVARIAASSVLTAALCTGAAAASWATPAAGRMAAGSVTPATAAATVRTATATVTAATAATAPAVATAATDATAYADALVRAWGAGNEYRANHYANDSVLGALFAHARVGGGHWWRIGSEGAAGTVYVTYRNGSSSSTLTIGVDNIGLGGGAGHNAYRVSFS